MSSGSSLIGSLHNIAQHSGPAISNAWLLTPISNVPFHPFPTGGYFFQHPSTPGLSAVAGLSRAFFSTVAYPNISEWSSARSAVEMPSPLMDCTVTVIHSPEAPAPSLPMMVQYFNAGSAPNMFPLYPQWSAGLDPRASLPVPNEGYHLPIPHHAGTQAYFYNPSLLGPQLPGQFSPYLQPYGPVPYRASRAVPWLGAPQPEMVMVLKEIQLQGTLPQVSTPELYYPDSTQQGTATSFQGMGVSPGLAPTAPTLGWPPTLELSTPWNSKAILCTEGNPSLESMSSDKIVADQASDSHVALSCALDDCSELPVVPLEIQGPSFPPLEILEPPSPLLEIQELPCPPSEILGPPSPLLANQEPLVPTLEDQEPPLSPLEIPDIKEILASIDLLPLEVDQPQIGQSTLSEQPVPGDLFPGQSSASLEATGNISELEGVTQAAPLLLPLKEESQPKGCQASKSESKATRADLDQTSGESTPGRDSSGRSGKQKRKSTEKAPETPEPEVHSMSSQIEPASSVSPTCSIGSGCLPQRPKLQKTPKAKKSKAKRPRLEEPEDLGGSNSEQTGGKGQLKINATPEEQSPFFKRKRRNDCPEFSQESFKKPRSNLGMHMLQSVQVFHKLGKKSPQARSISGIRERLGNSSSGEEMRKAQLGPLSVPKVHHTQKLGGNTDTQSKLPSEGKLKLVPLLTPERKPYWPCHGNPSLSVPCRAASSPFSSTYSSQHGVDNPPHHGLIDSDHPVSANLAQPDLAVPERSSLLNPAQPEPAISSLPEPGNPTWLNSVSASPEEASASSDQTEPATPSLPGPGNPTWLNSVSPCHPASTPSGQHEPALPNFLNHGSPTWLNSGNLGHPISACSGQPEPALPFLQVLGHPTQLGISSPSNPVSIDLVQSEPAKPFLVGPDGPTQPGHVSVGSPVSINLNQCSSVKQDQQSPPKPVQSDMPQPMLLGPGQPTWINCTTPTLHGAANLARSNLANPGCPPLTNTAWSGPGISASQPRPAHLAFPPRPNSTVPSQLAPIIPPNPVNFWSALPRPTPNPPVVTRPWFPHQFPNIDFSRQPNPWKIPTVPEPVVSTPITPEQRPEREAMKRQAQREREQAAKYSSLGKVQFFVERQKEMEISDYYGYTV
ncbi:uncharacterized protein C2orf78 homolog isoform X2 [Tachyglossus aculeatus]|nr:uncharacterized protein C2orf78 homolog isoform X2 [Tachyglossus aculeatus]